MRLETTSLRAEVDPTAGGCVRSLVDRGRGAELLFQSPWKVLVPAEKTPGPEAWTGGWPGGWHPLFPNAGEVNEFQGHRHGFHGAASVSAWELIRHDCTSLVACYQHESGLRLVREYVVSGRSLVVSNEVVNDSTDARAFVLVEHLILGTAIAGPGLLIELPGGRLLPMRDDGRPLVAAERTRDWPLACRTEVVEDWSVPGQPPFSRFGALLGLPQTRAGATNLDTGVGVHVEWSADTLGYLWLWHENGADQSMPGRAPIRCLGLEPASVPLSSGLAAAHRAGEATTLAPQAEWHSWTRLSVPPVIEDSSR